MNNRKILIINIIVFLVFLLLPCLISAQILPEKPPVDMSVSAGYDNMIKYTKMYPVNITLKSVKDIKCKLQIGDNRGSLYYEKECSLAANTAKQYTVYVLGQTGLPEVRCLVDNKLAVSEVINARVINPEDFLIAYLGDEKVQMPVNGKRSAITKGMFFTSYLKYEDLPDRWIGYEGVNLMIINNASISGLPVKQQQAIKNWVTMGGLLFISADANIKKFKDSFYADLIPVSVSESLTINRLDVIKNLFNQDFGGEDFLLTTGNLKQKNSRALLSENKKPVLSVGYHGEGTVLFFGADISKNPFKSWQGASDFWTWITNTSYSSVSDELLSSLVPKDDGYGGGGSWSYNYGVLLKFEGMKHINPRLIAIFLLFYFVFLIPVNYLILKKMDKLEYSWITMPAVIIVFTFIAIVIGYGFKPKPLYVNEVCVFDGREGETGGVLKTYTGARSSRRMNIDVEADNEEVILKEIPMRPQDYSGYNQYSLEIRKTSVYDSDKITLKKLFMDVGSAKIFYSSKPHVLNGTITADVDQVNDTAVFENKTGQVIKNPVLLLGSKYFDLKDINTGRSEISLSKSLLMGQQACNNLRKGKTDKWSAVIEWIFNEDILKKERTSGLLVGEFEIPFNAPKISYSSKNSENIPIGVFALNAASGTPVRKMKEYTLTKDDAEAVINGPGIKNMRNVRGYFYLKQNSNLEAVYDLSRFTRGSKIRGLKFLTACAYSQNKIPCYLYDFTTNTWDKVFEDRPVYIRKMNNNGFEFPVKDILKYIDSKNIIKIKIEPKNGNLEVSRLDLLVTVEEGF